MFAPKRAMIAFYLYHQPYIGKTNDWSVQPNFSSPCAQRALGSIGMVTSLIINNLTWPRVRCSSPV